MSGLQLSDEQLADEQLAVVYYHGAHPLWVILKEAYTLNITSTFNTSIVELLI